jgi:hypothetical protein
MSDVSGHEADHASNTTASGTRSHGHVPIDPNDAVVQAKPPSPRAFLVAAAAAVLTLAVLVAVAVASARGA